MFDIGWTELMLIAVVALVVIGPKDLPRAMRVVGQWVAKMKRMAREFQGQFNEALRETELESVHRDLQSIGKIDPLKDVRSEVTKTHAEIRKGFVTGAASAAKATAAPPGAPATTAVAETPAPGVIEKPESAAGDAKP